MKFPASLLKTFAAFSLSVLFTASSAGAGSISLTQSETAPLPYKLRADISVFGNTSSLNAADIVKVTGAVPPLTYAGTFIHPYSGFTWFVSRHYAVLSDLPDESVRDALVLLELAWPQYARIFRWRPPQGNKFRQAIVFAHDRETLERCMAADHLHSRLLGGLTQEGFACSYLYAGSSYQTRYILLHEATHLYQYCLSGDTRSCHGFMLEGIADYLSSHVFDPETETLMVNVLDRAPIHNHLANGLANWHKLGEPDFSTLYAETDLSRGLSVLMTAFLQHDKGLEAKWKLFCERVVRDSKTSSAREAAEHALLQFYGEPETLNQPFRTWISSLTPTYEILTRDFDQQGDRLISQAPASPLSPARMRINTGKINPQARTVQLQISRPDNGGDFAGLTQYGTTFIISNTWSHGCVFTLKTDTQILNEEIPVALMKAYQPPFTVTATLTNGLFLTTVSDRTGEEMTKHLHLRTASTNNTAVTLFASQPGIEFRSTLFPKPRKEPLEIIKLPETAFPDFSDKASLGPVSHWQITGPFPPAEKPSALPGNTSVWKTVSAHQATPVTPPLVNLAEVFGKPTDNLTVFAAADITAEESATADLVIGVADKARIILNGEEIGRFDGKREWSDGNLTIRGVALKKGANRLLLELTSAGNAPLFSVRTKIPLK